MKLKELADRLIRLSEEKQFSICRRELYEENAICIEADGQKTIGLDAMDEKEKNWDSSIEEIHDIKFSNPIISGSFFSVGITWDLTYKGQERTIWNEIAVFEVRKGKVVLEKFFY